MLHSVTWIHNTKFCFISILVNLNLIQQLAITELTYVKYN